FSDLAIVKKEDEIVRMMKIIEPRLEGLSVQRGMIWGDIEGMERLIPLPLMGDGIGRFLDIVLAISVAQDGILLIDEIENGFHHSIMSQVWKAIDEWAKEYTVQVFATTHSEECLRAAHQTFAASEQYDFALHRLEQVKGAIRAVTFDQETLDAAIEMDAEVR
ncbi:MAG: ATP-binding protein, partial [Anaerolineae bacterium]|nr:ATP-binding protein [Anaerolineae bacterium]